MAIYTSLALEFFVKNWNNFERNKFLLSENGSLNSKSARYNPQKQILNKDTVTRLRRSTVFIISLRLKRYMSMLVFLWSAFLRFCLVSTFSLAFKINSFSLLSAFKIIEGLPRARSVRGTEPHTHGIWSTSFRLVVT